MRNRATALALVVLVPLVLAAAEQRLEPASWGRHLERAPSILVVNALPEALLGELKAQEEILFSLLSTGPEDVDALVASRLGGQIEALKSATPETAVSKGSRAVTQSVATAGGSSASARTYTDPKVRKDIERATDPGLVRDVRNVVLNADIGSLDTRIGGLRDIHEKWTEHTAKLSTTSETVKLQRDANIEFLKRLAEYIKQWEALGKEARELRAAIASRQVDRGKAAESWQAFEAGRLEALGSGLAEASSAEIGSTGGYRYMLGQKQVSKVLIAKCSIAGKTVFLRLNSGEFPFHPLHLESE